LVMSSVKESTRPRLANVAGLSLLVGRTPMSNFQSLDWSGETELVVVANSTTGVSTHRARMDGSVVEDLGPLSEQPEQVSALPGPSGSAVVIRSADDEVWRHDANRRWTRLEGVLQDVTYPG